MWHITFAAMIASAWPFSDTIRSASCSSKNSQTVRTPLAMATLATLADGSIPR